MALAFNESSANVEYLGVVNVPPDNTAAFIAIVEDVGGEIGSWEGVGILVLGEVQLSSVLALQDRHEDLKIGSFDVSLALFEAINGGKVLFGVDQNSYLQWYLAVALATWFVYTRQLLLNPVGESGPTFIEAAPTSEQQVCASVKYNACQLNQTSSDPTNTAPAPLLSAGAIAGIVIAGVAAMILLLFVLYHVRNRSSARNDSAPPKDAEAACCQEQSVTGVGAQTNNSS